MISHSTPDTVYMVLWSQQAHDPTMTTFPYTDNNYNPVLSPAHYLTGNVTFMKDETLKKADSWSVRYYLSEISKKSSSSTTNSNNNSNGNNKTEAGEKKTKLEEFEESSRDHKTTWLSKLEKGKCLIWARTQTCLCKQK